VRIAASAVHGHAATLHCSDPRRAASARVDNHSKRNPMPLDQDALASLRRDSAGPIHRERSRWSRKALLAVLAAVIVGAVVLWRVAGSAVPVKTAVVEAAEDGDGAVLNASGYVVARRLATVSSKVTGRITEVLFEEGASVKEGQLLARLDPATAQAEYLVATRNLEAARRNLREIEVRLAEAERTLVRNRTLVQQRLIAQSVLDTSEADVAALHARLEASRAEVGVAEGRVGLSRQGLDDLEIRAPFSGVVISKDAQPGETVSPISAGGGFTRTGIATIVDMDSREIEVDVNEAYINRVHDEQRVEAVLDAYPDWVIPGHVISIVPTADRQKATVRVRIAFEQLDPRILPDMGIKVRFLEEAKAGAPAAPKVDDRALVRDESGVSVWVVRDGKVERRAVQLGASADGRTIVTEGLVGGESVVLEPPGRLHDGSPVELVAQ
jgi:RND family efflux transporter MFP subunit